MQRFFEVSNSYSTNRKTKKWETEREVKLVAHGKNVTKLQNSNAFSVLRITACSSFFYYIYWLIVSGTMWIFSRQFTFPWMCSPEEKVLGIFVKILVLIIFIIIFINMSYAKILTVTVLTYVYINVIYNLQFFKICDVLKYPNSPKFS